MISGKAPAGGWTSWFRNQDAALSVFLPLLLVSTVLSWPLRALLPVWVFDVLAIVTVVLGVLILVPSPRLAVVAGAFALAVMVQRVAGYGRGTLIEKGPELAFFLFVAAALAARVFRPGRITVHRLLGAVALFVVLGVGWGLAYQAHHGWLRGRRAGPALREVARSPGSPHRGALPVGAHRILARRLLEVAAQGPPRLTAQDRPMRFRPAPRRWMVPAAPAAPPRYGEGA
jgi:hypothetical protein